ncbi:Ig-like domain-containing protein, partial [uncultured Flavobacterium sp.]|uniref:Ig-like domain-containing protein n=1 Tax=uncultured Flavobacterium sp. TaxID=165435 RepID=UPI0025DA593D
MQNNYGTKKTFRGIFAAHTALLAALLFIAGSQKLFSQAAIYGFSQTQESYAELDNPTVIATPSALTGANSVDDQVYQLPANTIPFPFTFNNAAYTTVNVYANGFLSFGTTATNATSPLSESYAYADVVAAMATDLHALYNVNGLTGNISYKVTGTAPNREFVVQWSHFRPYVSAVPTDTYWDWNFQVRLKENNTIAVTYKLNVTGTPSSSAPQVGLRGASGADFNNRTASGSATTWQASAAGTSSYSSMTTNTSTLPAAGLTFNWAPPAQCVAPAAQPTNLTLSNTGIIINGSFTAASPAADRYLILRTIGNEVPTAPVNGTVYATGQNTSLNAYVAYYGTATTFENNYNNGIRGNNKYNYFIYAVNSSCTGGPLYLTENPLTQNIVNCPITVNGITVSNTTANSFRLNWPEPENGSALPYNTVIEVATDSGFANMVSGSPFTLNPSQLSQNVNGLEANTQYFYRGKNVSSCASTYSTTASTWTGCLPVSEFSENFNITASSQLPNCWKKITTASGGYPMVGVSSAPATPAVNLSNDGANANLEASRIILISPQLTNLSAGTHRLRFKAYKGITTGNDAAIQVVTLSDNSATATATNFAELINVTASYAEYAVYFDSYTGNDTYIGLRRKGAVAYTNLYIDDIVWEPIPACPELATLVSSTPTPTGATLLWTDPANSPPAGGYEYFISSTNTIPAETETFTQVSNALLSIPVTVTQGGTYYAFVRRVCSQTEKSPWKSVSFTTIPVTPSPWMEGFAAASTPNGWSITGWEPGTSVRVPDATTNVIHKNLYASAPTGTFSTISVGPVLEGDVLGFSFRLGNWNATNGIYAPPASGSGSFTVAISTDFGATFTDIATRNNDGTAGWQDYSYDLTPYVGQYVKIRITAMRTSGDYVLGFDNFKIGPVVPASVDVATENNVPAEITINEGTLQLMATVNPTGASQAVTWTVVSGNEFAAISESGLVSAVANGTVTVRAASAADATLFDEITITITGQVVIPTSVDVSTENNIPAEITINEGTLQLMATV